MNHVSSDNIINILSDVCSANQYLDWVFEEEATNVHVKKVSIFLSIWMETVLQGILMVQSWKKNMQEY